jgi:hypothetical protein
MPSREEYRTRYRSLSDHELQRLELDRTLPNEE